MIKRRRAVLVAALAVGLWLVIPKLLRPPPYEMVGERAPDIELPMADPSAKPFKLSDARGKVVVLAFFATWCDDCALQIPIIERAARGKDVLSFAVFTNDERASLEPWLAKHPVTMPIALDLDDRAARALEVNNMPLVVIVGKDGTVVDVEPGYTSEAVARVIDGALK